MDTETKDRLWCVYIHTSPSNKKYIGITSKKPEVRWRNGNGYNHNKHFKNAIKKYGWDNFEHEIVAECLTEEEAQKMERELIEKYNTFNGNNGYNQTSGGEKGKEISDEMRRAQSELAKKCWNDEAYRQSHIEYLKTLTGEKNPNYGNHKLAGENHPNWGKHLNEETRRKIGEANKNPSDETRKKLSEAAKRNMTQERKEQLRNIHIGSHLSDETRQKMSKSQKERWTEDMRIDWSKKFSGKNNGMFGKHHSEETKQKLSEMFSGENSIWYGRKHTEEELQKMHDSSPLKISVIQLNLDGSYVATHSSYGYAAKSVDGRESWISECCNGKAKSAYGYMWVKESDYNPNNVIPYKNSRFKSTVQLDLNLRWISEYETVADAGRAVNGNGQNIGRACKEGCVYKGYRWMYKEDYIRLINNRQGE